MEGGGEWDQYPVRITEIIKKYKGGCCLKCSQATKKS